MIFKYLKVENLLLILYFLLERKYFSVLLSDFSQQKVYQT